MTDPYGGDIVSVAGVYAGFLDRNGSSAITRAERETVARLSERSPYILPAARSNRAFLGRVVRYLAEERGIRQFLDIGSGLPAQDNVHQVAERVCPGARVVYVDNDPKVLLRAQALLMDDRETGFVQADLREPQGILNNSQVCDLIDFREPVALLMVAILHFIADADDPYGIVGRFRASLVPGSYVVITHGGVDFVPEYESQINSIYEEFGLPRPRNRTRDDVLRLFSGLDMLPPGLVATDKWKPADKFHAAETAAIYAGVAKVPARISS